MASTRKRRHAGGQRQGIVTRKNLCQDPKYSLSDAIKREASTGSVGKNSNNAPPCAQIPSTLLREPADISSGSAMIEGNDLSTKKPAHPCLMLHADAGSSVCARKPCTSFPQVARKGSCQAWSLSNTHPTNDKNPVRPRYSRRNLSRVYRRL